MVDGLPYGAQSDALSDAQWEDVVSSDSDGEFSAPSSTAASLCSIAVAERTQLERAERLSDVVRPVQHAPPECVLTTTAQTFDERRRLLWQNVVELHTALRRDLQALLLHTYADWVNDCALNPAPPTQAHLPRAMRVPNAAYYVTVGRAVGVFTDVCVPQLLPRSQSADCAFAQDCRREERSKGSPWPHVRRVQRRCGALFICPGFDARRGLRTRLLVSTLYT
jgi:hypothetical protein